MQTKMRTIHRILPLEDALFTDRILASFMTSRQKRRIVSIDLYKVTSTRIYSFVQRTERDAQRANPQTIR